MAKSRPARLVDRPTDRGQAGLLELVTGRNGQGTMLKRLPYAGTQGREDARQKLMTLALEMNLELLD